MYPLYQEVKPETDFPIFIYIEECPDLMLLNMILDYNQDEIDFINIDNSHLAGYGLDVFQTSSVNEGILNINSALLNGQSINNYNSNGNIKLIKINFYSKSNFLYNEITINENSICRNLHYQDIGFNRIGAIVNLLSQ